MRTHVLPLCSTAKLSCCGGTQRENMRPHRRPRGACFTSVFHRNTKALRWNTEVKHAPLGLRCGRMFSLCVPPQHESVAVEHRGKTCVRIADPGEHVLPLCSTATRKRCGGTQ